MPQLKPRTRTQSVEGAFRDTSEGSIESVEPKAKRSWGAGPPVNTRIVPEADCSADLPYKRLSRRRSFCREAALDEGVQFSCFVGKMLSKLPEEQVEEPVVEPTIPRLLQFSQWMLLGLLKACGISAFGSSEEQPRIFIKAYHCLLILMFIAEVAFAAVELVSCRLQSDLILSRFCFDDSGPATDLAVFSGALGVLIYSGGWCYSARRAMLRETTEVLAVLMQDQGLASAWARTTGRDATVAVVIWLALALSRIVRTALLDRRTYASILSSAATVALAGRFPIADGLAAVRRAEATAAAQNTKTVELFGLHQFIECLLLMAFEVIGVRGTSTQAQQPTITKAVWLLLYLRWQYELKLKQANEKKEQESAWAEKLGVSPDTALHVKFWQSPAGEMPTFDFFVSFA
ncbi:hypothetical protein AK812_SmicGene18998 [Symbiodinium microadriaticum]|uniref:Uncharacterized protein n=1 Tax=Symbiodinium microadriaticum TaxID=2951 RepID=A0A1Q9DTQ1_SYMMI|nr:hypothetical protein AK812_SmicGene18998 [Symbiodinium microadriaticum]